MSYPTWLNDILPCPETGDRLQSNGNNQSPSQPPASINAGYRLRQLRIEHGLSIRTLAKQSGLNVNTLSMIENNKTSPSVSTLQQVATALKEPITTFFGTETLQRRIVYQKADNHQAIPFSHGTLADLGSGFSLLGLEPFIVNLDLETDSGDTPIVHNGIEFVYCLDGGISYEIEAETFNLESGDRLLFEVHLPHRRRNGGKNALASFTEPLPVG
jgi:transcriptional regulator with XRE-family HTH domain